MIQYLINNINKRYYLYSPFNSDRFLYQPEKGEDRSTLPGSIYYISIEPKAESYFQSPSGHVWKRFEDVTVEYKFIVNSTHPYTHTVGPGLHRYDAIFKIETSIVKIFLYVKYNETSERRRKLPNVGVNDIKRNASFSWGSRIWRVMRVEDVDKLAKDVSSIFTLKRFNKQDTKRDLPILICYDVETLWDAEGVIRPFIICAETTIDDSTYMWCKSNKNLKDIDNFEEGVESFVDWLISKIMIVANFYGCFYYPYPNHKLIRFFGYNNFNFDNHMFYDKMRQKLTNFSYVYNSRFGKTTSCSFRCKGLEFSCVDLIKFFPGRSLANACASFKIEQAKYDVNILKYCTACCERQEIIEKVSDINEFFKEGAAQDEEFFAPFKDEAGQYNIYEFIKVYCKRDVSATMELYAKTSENMINIFKEFEKLDVFVNYYDIFAYISPPQVAFIILKGLLAKAGQRILIFRDNKFAAKVHDTYFGGHTDYTFIGHCFPTPDKNGNCEYKYYDVTSEYPTTYDGYFASARVKDSIFIGQDFPLLTLQTIIDKATVRRNDLFASRRLHLTYDYLKAFCEYRIFVTCNIFPPERESEVAMWAPIGRKIYTGNSVRLEFQNVAQLNRNCNTPQICLLILMGWRVELVEDETNICFSETERLLQDYVRIVGKQKTLAVDNKALRDLWKLLLNSLYGKLAMKYKNTLATQEGDCDDEVNVRVNEKLETFDFSQSYHYISADITGWATFMLNKKCYFAELEQIYNGRSLAERVNTVVYCDTDSLIFNMGKVSSFLEFKIGEEIGLWDDDLGMFDETYKEETFGEEKIASLIILAKKCYFPIDRNSNILSIKVKGLHKNEAKYITFDDLKRVCDGKELKFSFPGIVKRPQMLANVNLTYREDFVKTLLNAVLKKTVKRDRFYEGDILPVKCPATYAANQLAIERKLYKEDVNRFLVFIPSTLVDRKWQIENELKKARVLAIIEDTINNHDNDTSGESDPE